MKRKNVIILVLAVLLLISLLTACNGSAKVQGKYFKENSDGTLDYSSWIELLKGGKWIDDEGAGGKYVIKDNTIEFYIDEIPDEVFLDGTIENGIITIEFAGSIVYRKEGSGENNTQGNPTVDSKASVKSITGGKVEGLAVSLDVSNTIDNVDLSGMITVSSGSSWQLYEDITGQKIIPTKYAANLKNGDNTYYIVVNSDDGKINRTYTLIIHKKYYLTVTYMSEGSVFKTEQILSNTTLGEGPSITRVGYSFDGWGSNGQKIIESKTFTASWSANIYTVTLNPNSGNLIETTKNLVYGNQYTLPIPSRSDYSFKGWFTARTGGKQLTNKNGSSMSVWSTPNNSTVYAQWTENLPVDVKTLEELWTDSESIFNGVWGDYMALDTVGLSDNVKSVENMFRNVGILDVQVNKVLSADNNSFIAFEVSDVNNVMEKIQSSPSIISEMFIRYGESNILYAIFNSYSINHIFDLNVVYENNCWFTSDGSVLIRYKDNDYTSNYTVPSNVTEIGVDAFASCYHLEHVVLNEGITEIGFGAFNSSGIQSIVIPNSVTIIETAFYNCSFLTTIYYGGTDDTAWNNIAINELSAEEDSLSDATIYYYSETYVSGGTHWRFVDGVPTIW